MYIEKGESINKRKKDCVMEVINPPPPVLL